jgi:hypothetical protein
MNDTMKRGENKDEGGEDETLKLWNFGSFWIPTRVNW